MLTHVQVCSASQCWSFWQTLLPVLEPREVGKGCSLATLPGLQFGRLAGQWLDAVLEPLQIGPGLYLGALLGQQVGKCWTCQVWFATSACLAWALRFEACSGDTLAGWQGSQICNLLLAWDFLDTGLMQCWNPRRLAVLYPCQVCTWAPCLGSKLGSVGPGKSDLQPRPVYFGSLAWALSWEACSGETLAGWQGLQICNLPLAWTVSCRVLQ